MGVAPQSPLPPKQGRQWPTMSFDALSFAHEEQLKSYLRFFRTKRKLQLEEVVATIRDQRERYASCSIASCCPSLLRGPPPLCLHLFTFGSPFGVWRSPPDLSVGWDAGVKTGLLPPVCLLRDCTSLTKSHGGSAGRQHVGQGASPSCRWV